ncbi:MAG: zinc ribbon domain-containing protein [Clostridiales bacterium]|jgi:DNA-directed RNA polymerase subunit RPC12/RpoP|nr:zinc ribbon domain-containing protein [Clostridiales bacterium]
MALFDDIKKKVADTTQGAVKATKEFAETARLNSRISEEQRKIGSLYSQIGKLYYERRREDAEPPFDELCAAITAATEQIEKLQSEIQLVKGVKRCPNCGFDLPLTAVFCGKCGSKVETPEARTEPTAPEVRLCAHCGEELENGAVFCGSCGQKL